MASVIDVIRTVFGCKHSALKMITLSGILSYPLYQICTNFQGWFDLWSIVTYCVLIFYFGYIFLASYNLINEEEILLPGFLNPFKIFFVGIGSIFALVPMIALMVYVGYCLYAIFLQKEFPMALTITGVVVAEFILLGILAVQMTLYSTKFNPLHSYNIVKIFKTSPDFSLKSILLFIVLAIFSAFVLYPLGYLTFKMFGNGFVLFFVSILCITMILLFITQYYSQMAIESIVLGKKDEYETAGSIMDKELLIDNDKY